LAEWRRRTRYRRAMVDRGIERRRAEPRNGILSNELFSRKTREVNGSF